MRKAGWRWWLGVAAVVFATGAQAWTRSLTPEQYRADLVAFKAGFLEKNKSFPDGAKARFAAEVDGQIARADALDDPAFVYGLWRATAIADDVHTGARTAAWTDRFPRLPLRFFGFADGVFVVRTDAANADLVGARIVRIGTLSTDEAIARVTPYFGGPPNWRAYRAYGVLQQLPFLETIGACTSCETVEVELVLADGRRVVRTLGAAASRSPVDDQPLWRATLVPAAPAEAVSGWTQALRGIETPTYLRDPDRILVERIDALDALYVRANAMKEEKDYSLLDATDKLIDLATARRPRNVIVDLRFNGGGNFFRALAFARAVARIPGPQGCTYIVTGTPTASAAIVTTSLIRAQSNGCALIAGEPKADRDAFWAEGGALELPVSKLAAYYTDGYHDWARGCFDWDRCYVPAAIYGVSPGPLDVDLPVAPTFAQYAAGRDVVLERIAQHVANRGASAPVTKP